MTARYRWAAAAASILFSALLLAPVATAAPGPARHPHVRNGLIAYAAPDEVLNGDIGAWVARPDGSHTRSLSLGSFSYSVAWSPDGRRLVVQAWQGTVMRPVVVRPDGRDARVLHPSSQFDEADVAPCIWMPTGRQLICEVINFNSDDHSRDGLWLMDARDLSNARRLTTNPYPPSGEFGGGDIPGGVSPDGKWVVFTRARQDFTDEQKQTGAIYVVGTDGRGLRQLTAYGVANSHGDALSGFSPDGKTILFGGHDSTILTIRPDGSGLRAVPVRGLSGKTWVRSPTWSPDGRQILARIYQENSVGLYTLTPQGVILTKIKAPEDAEVAVWGAR